MHGSACIMISAAEATCDVSNGMHPLTFSVHLWSRCAFRVSPANLLVVHCFELHVYNEHLRSCQQQRHDGHSVTWQAPAILVSWAIRCVRPAARAAFAQKPLQQQSAGVH